MTSSKFFVTTLAVVSGLLMASCGPQNPPVVTREKGKQPDSVLVYKYFNKTGQKELQYKNTYQYDAAGNAILVIEGETKYVHTYDAVGNKTSEIQYNQVLGKNEWYEEYLLTYVYNELYRVIQTTRLNPANEDGTRDTSAVVNTEWKDYYHSHSKQYNYLKKSGGEFGKSLAFVWDTYYTDFGKLEKQVTYYIHPDSTLSELYHNNYTYDEHHNLIRYSQYMSQQNELSISQTYEYTYDEEGTIRSAVRKDWDKDGKPKYDFELHYVYYYPETKNAGSYLRQK